MKNCLELWDSSGLYRDYHANTNKQPPTCFSMQLMKKANLFPSGCSKKREDSKLWPGILLQPNTTSLLWVSAFVYWAKPDKTRSLNIHCQKRVDDATAAKRGFMILLQTTLLTVQTDLHINRRYKPRTKVLPASKKQTNQQTLTAPGDEAC